jgi:hypothetical protein
VSTPLAFPLTPIGNATDGECATFRGRVCLAGSRRLIAALSEKPCVYWEVNESLSSGVPERFEGLPFWLEDETGRVLVRPESVDVATRAERRTRAIALVDADLNQVSDKIRKIKADRRKAAGRRAKELLSEHKKLKNLATFLCAIRAQARGNVHTGKTLKGQERYLRKHASKHEGKAVDLIGEQFEVTLQEGDEVEIRGLCVIAMLPPGVGHSGGYRDAPTGVQVRAPVGRRLEIRGLGDVAPVTVSEAQEHKGNVSRMPERKGLWRRFLGFLYG